MAPRWRSFGPPELLDLVIEARDVSEDNQALARAWAAQPSLFDGLDDDEEALQLEALEQIPWTFKYRYRCSDAGRNTHTQDHRRPGDRRAVSQGAWSDRLAGSDASEVA